VKLKKYSKNLDGMRDMIKFARKNNFSRINNSNHVKSEFWEYDNGLIRWFVKSEGHTNSYVICKCGEWIPKSFIPTFLHLIHVHNFPLNLEGKVYRITPTIQE